jgi:hypothetical protein
LDALLIVARPRFVVVLRLATALLTPPFLAPLVLSPDIPPSSILPSHALSTPLSVVVITVPPLVALVTTAAIATVPLHHHFCKRARERWRVWDAKELVSNLIFSSSIFPIFLLPTYNC